MNLIEKVAKAIGNELVDGDNGCLLITTQEQRGMLAQAAIAAMPSIKWQKIETLPSYKDARKILIWCGVPAVVMYYSNRDNYFKFGCDYNQYVDHTLVTHWAEINVPEDK